MIEWRIYYGDGATVDSDMCQPQDVPTYDCQVIVQRDPVNNRSLMDGHDWFIYHRSQQHWLGIDASGLYDYLLHDFQNVQVVLQGRMTSNRHFNAIYQTAVNDPDFPRRAGGLNRLER